MVGGVLNLAVFFAWHTYWPPGTAAAAFEGGIFDGFPVIVAIPTFAALRRLKADTTQVIGLYALLGLIYSAAL